MSGQQCATDDMDGLVPLKMMLMLMMIVWLVVSTPLKNMSPSVGIMTFPIYGEIKDVPNHQPVVVVVDDDDDDVDVEANPCSSFTDRMRQPRASEGPPRLSSHRLLLGASSVRKLAGHSTIIVTMFRGHGKLQVVETDDNDVR